MNSEFENKGQPGQKEQYRAEDLSLKGYYTIAVISVIIGFVIVGILNLVTPLQIISERLAYLSRLSTPFRLLNIIPPILFLLMVYFAYRMLISFMLRPIAKYLKLHATGGSLSKGLAKNARRRLLNIPFMFIPLNMGIWIVLPAAIFLGAYLGDQMDLRTAVIISARTSMVGLISSFMASHRMEAYSRRKLIPFFFPNGRLADVRGTFRISISRRIRLLNRLGNVVPGIILLVTLATLHWELDAPQISSAEYSWIIIRFSLILCIIFFYMTHVLNRVGSRNITEPIKEILRVIKRIRKGQFDEKVRVVSNDEIGYTGDVINEMTEGLKERDLMKRSLELAMEVQQNLLPKENPRIKGLDIAGKSIYCDETGGDYYDFIKLNGNGPANIAIVVGDVSGHGIPSALLMATARAFIRLRTSLTGGLAQVISDVNRQIVRDVEETGQFMTLFFLTVDQERRGMEWVRAGHDPGIFYDPARDLFEDLAGPGMALGVDGAWNYESNRKNGLEEGQIIVLGTDGIWEAQSPEGQMFGKEALCRIIRENAAADANRLLEDIIDSLDHFRDGFQLQDDVTLIVVKIGKD
ncbi:Serine phosphatase RsbU, regulator of sigma subunit [Olavius algarvensis Delta 1 endosymbiont]|nr:Serine phosphatase RsbU, regulator of sigma subunit [Olavius algarvensis Delta 1 endosymbiont]